MVTAIPLESYIERPPLQSLAGVVRTAWIQRTGGAAYAQRHLPTLAVRVLLHPPTVSLRDSPQPPTPWRAWRDGTIVNLLNPKVGLFFVASLPQFVDTSPAAAPPGTQLAVLGLIFLGLALLLDVAYAQAGGVVARLVARKGQTITWLRWPVAGVYVTLATWTFLA